MSEPRKNHLSIDGAQVKEDDNVASYKPIPESETEFRPPSKASHTKSKEKLSSDPAEEKLLSKEDEAKIVTRVDMAEAKYVVGDHRNGDAKIELDANKRQFSGLTKEELLKYADDPFWRRLRWFMFIMFWALWLGMLAGAIAIIVCAPKCAPPPAKTWYEIGPLSDYSSESTVDYAALEAELPLLEDAKVQGIFVNPCEDTYEVLSADNCIQTFKGFLEKAKKRSLKVIVDLTANFVPTTHTWFAASENRSAEFNDYFVWGVGKDSVPDGTRPNVPNNWVSRENKPAWSWSEKRKEYYLHQYNVNQADLNFHNAAVVKRFDEVLRKWMEAGAAGVRLLKARQLLVNPALPDEDMSKEKSSLSSSLNDYNFLRHKHTADQPQLDEILAHWAQVVAASGQDTVFTLHEDGVLNLEWYRYRNSSVLRPPSAAPLVLSSNVDQLAKTLDLVTRNWTALQLTSSDPDANVELASFAMLLPVTPVLAPGQLPEHSNNTLASEAFSHLSTLRDDASIKYGERHIEVVNSTSKMIACARWKPGHTGYVAVYNAGAPGRADLAALTSLPDSLTVHHVSRLVKEATNYTNNMPVPANNVLVPANSAVILSYVPKSSSEK